jgi:DNA-binding transcriptional MerR regulator
MNSNSNAAAHTDRAPDPTGPYEEDSASQPDARAAGSPRGTRESGTDVAKSQFKTREVVDLLELSRRQLQYWAKTGLIEPSARTPGGHHRYSFDDLVALKATKRLIDAGVSVQKIRKSVRALQKLLPQIGRPLSELVLVATGDVVLVFQDDTVFEAVSGQEWVFEVASFEREVSAYRSGDSSTVRSSDASAAAVSAGKSSASNTQSDGLEAPGKVTGDLEKEALDAKIQGVMPAKPGPRGAKSADKDWSQTG